MKLNDEIDADAPETDADLIASQDQREVDQLLQRYFDGLYQSDSTLLRQVFHPNLAYVNATVGNHEFLGLEAYMSRIDGRVSPAKTGDARCEIIDRISLKGGQIGIVEARMSMLGRTYQDLLTLIRSDGGWQVLTKVFTHAVPEE